ncbi:MAG: Ger(x)C family spore germination protein [Alicyclobacillus sp.]|nr:Ger(x)C family spore germination protein [Alicyclobacillus sp.]
MANRMSRGMVPSGLVGARHRLRAGAVAVCLILCMMCSGCWDAHEIDQLAIVTVSGLDAVGDGQGVLGSVQIARPSQLGTEQGGSPTSGGGAGQTFVVVQGQANSPAAALEVIRRQVPRLLILSHRQAVVLGEAYAARGVAPLIDEMVRNPASRLRTIVLVAYHARAVDLLRASNPLERLPADAIRGLEEQSGLPRYNLKDFINGMYGPSDPFALGVRQVSSGGRPKLVIDRIAVFHKDRLAGWLSGPAMDGFLWLKGRMQTHQFTVPMPGLSGEVGVQVLSLRRRLTVDAPQGQPRAKVQLQVRTEVVENGSAFNPNDPQQMQRLQQAVERHIREEVRATLTELQSLQADAVGFGDLLYARHPRAWKPLQTQWRQRFAQMPVQLAIDVRVDRSGLTHVPPSANQTGAGPDGQAGQIGEDGGASPASGG